MGTMTDTEQQTERMVQRVGTTADGSYMVVTAEIRRRAGTWQTVTHERAIDPTELSVTGELYKARTSPKRHEPISAGQNIDDLADVVNPAPGWTLEEIAELRSLWDRWHLNAMRAACAHMDPATLAREDDGYGGTRVSTRDPRNVCPETGYQYGHAWLVESVPAEVLNRVRHLMRDRSDDLYRARGYDMQGRKYPTD